MPSSQVIEKELPRHSDSTLPVARLGRHLWSVCSPRRNRVAAAALVLMLSACPDSVEKKKLLLFGGAGLRPPVAQLAQMFARREGVNVECDYAGSEVLLSRIRLVRRGDLYIPGEAHYVDLARREGLVYSSRKACCLVPVILVPKGNPARIQGLLDFARPGVRIGLGDPRACAIGRASRQLFDRATISYDGIKDNIVVSSLTVNELGLHIKSGKVDAVIIWDAVAAQYRGDGEIVPLPRGVVSRVPVAVLSFSKQKALAEKFAAFVSSEDGKRIFRQHSYTVEAPGCGEQ